MNSLKLLLIIFILLISRQFLFSQEKTESLILLHSIGKASCEDLLVRIDSLVGEMSKHPNSKGYVVIYGGLDPIQSHFHKSFFTRYSVMRGSKDKPYSVITTKGEEDLKVEFWISKDGTKPRVNEVSFDYVLSQPKIRYFFAEESGELVKIDGKETFVGDCPACCIKSLELGLLAEILEANQNFNAQIVISNKTNRNQFVRFAKFLSDEATIEYKIPRSRLRIIYGVNKGGGYIWNKNMASINVTLVSPTKKNK